MNMMPALVLPQLSNYCPCAKDLCCQQYSCGAALGAVTEVKSRETNQSTPAVSPVCVMHFNSV